MPAWQAVVPLLVPKDDLPAGIAANSVGVNISRAIGPGIGGMAISSVGIVAPFWLNAISNLGIVGALLWWHEPKKPHTLLPAERFGRAIWTGLRYADTIRIFAARLVRATGFFLFASAYWALLPLVARSQIAGGPGLYGVLLGVDRRRCGRRRICAAVAEIEAGPDRLMAVGAPGAGTRDGALWRSP